MTTERKWLRVEMVADDPSTAEMHIFGIIGSWIDDLFEDIGFGFDSVTTAKSFQQELENLPETVKTIRLRVNSPGGDVFGAVAIANMLREQPNTSGRRVESFVEGLAASAASLVIQAGEEVRVADNALIMIHNPWTRAVGNAAELRKAADELDTITRGSIIPTYQWHSELGEDEIAAMLDDETWMDADEAIANGFATEKVSGLRAAACIAPTVLSSLNVPEKYKDRVESLVLDATDATDATDAPSVTGPADTSASDTSATDTSAGSDLDAAEAVAVLNLCKDAGCLDIAAELIAAKASLPAVKERVAKERKSRADAKARSDEIHALCKRSQLEELAKGYIDSGMPAAVVRTHLTTITARLDVTEIDGGIDPNNQFPDNKKSWKDAFARVQRQYGTRAPGGNAK